MKRKTIIYAIVDDKNKKFVVRNRNTENFDKKFQDIFKLCEFEDERIDHIAILSRLNDFIKDDNWKFYHVFDAENVYNRDQKEINRRKAHYTNEYILSGYEEDPSLDNNGANIHYNNEAVEAAKNLRNIVTIYNEKAEEAKNKKRRELREDLDKIEEEYKVNVKILNNAITEKREQVENLKREHDKLLNIITQKEDIEKSLTKLNDDYEKLNYDYKSKNNSIISLSNQINKLKIEYQKLKDECEVKQQILNDIENKSVNFNKVDRFYLKDYNELKMWQNFAHEYGYDKTGIMQLRADLDNYIKNI